MARPKVVTVHATSPSSAPRRYGAANVSDEGRGPLPKIDSTPLVPRGTAYATHRLVESPRGLVLRKTWRTWGWGVVGIAIGAVFLVPGVLAQASGVSASGLCTVLLGLFMLAGGLTFIVPRAVRFETATRVVVVSGRRIPFSDIRAVQLLREHVPETEGPDFDSYELNLVLRDGSRVNLVDHSGRNQLEGEARQLTRLLDCELVK